MMIVITVMHFVETSKRFETKINVKKTFSIRFEKKTIKKLDRSNKNEGERVSQMKFVHKLPKNLVKRSTDCVPLRKIVFSDAHRCFFVLD